MNNKKKLWTSLLIAMVVNFPFVHLDNAIAQPEPGGGMGTPPRFILGLRAGYDYDAEVWSLGGQFRLPLGMGRGALQIIPSGDVFFIDGSTDLHVSYRPEINSSDPKNQQNEERMQRMMARRRENLPKPGMIIIIQGEDRSERNEHSLEGPAAGSAYENGVFSYEFKIPIPISTGSNNEVKLGLELGGISDEDRKAMMQEMGGMRGSGGRRGGGMGVRPGGMGGRPGGMGGKPGGMRGGERPSGGFGFEKQEMWFTVVLATENSSD